MTSCEAHTAKVCAPHFFLRTTIVPKSSHERPCAQLTKRLEPWILWLGNPPFLAAVRSGGAKQP